MHELKVVDNISLKLLDELFPAIEQAKNCKIAVAFVSKGGFSLIKPAIERCLINEGSVELIVGLDLSMTDPGVLWELFQLRESFENVNFWCISEIEEAVLFHPKLYIAEGDFVTIVVGSSNLTEGGLKENVEINLSIVADPGEEIVSDVLGVYNLLKKTFPLVSPDDEFIALYEELHLMRKRKEQTIHREERFKRVRQKFREKVASLKRPEVSPQDLVGWQRLVFERLPQGEFRTSDIYRFEREFAKFYPENRNIKAKIRQILQQLRDLGLIKHKAKGVWVKGG